ncbi:hypothetical protein ACIOKD_27790 [Streptomyces sp. NPDC087844]|uniref:hypothetical protein n=1 Tax=Streptomyces sp. NPDC087844 TaxID=3365805 RepID=UPI003827416F
MKKRLRAGAAPGGNEALGQTWTHHRGRGSGVIVLVAAGERALADDRAATTKALDTGADPERLAQVRKLPVHRSVRGDGARALGAAVSAVTRAHLLTPGARRHSVPRPEHTECHQSLARC